MTAFYDVRVEFYGRRKRHLLNTLTDAWEKLDNKVRPTCFPLPFKFPICCLHLMRIASFKSAINASGIRLIRFNTSSNISVSMFDVPRFQVRFILRVIDGSLVVSNRKKNELLDELKAKGFKLFTEKKQAKKDDENANNNDEEEDDSSAGVSLSQGFDYLLSMKIWSLTMEKVKALTLERDEKKDELDVLAAKTAEDLWLEDLDALEESLDAFEGELVAAEKQEAAARKKAQVRNNLIEFSPH